MSDCLPSAKGANPPPAKWNRALVSSYLVPVLKYRELMQSDTTDDNALACAEQETSRAIMESAAGYAQMLRVYRIGSDAAIDQWFGGIDCDDELLADAFHYIEEILTPPPGEPEPAADSPKPQDFHMENAFRSLFRITEQEKTVDLYAPLEEYYECNEHRYGDYEYRRIEIAERVKSLLRQYMHQYLRALEWYRANVSHPKDAGVPSDDGALRPESHVCMQLLEQWIARYDYEDRITRSIQSLEYERGGLGWFHRKRKSEIDRSLHELRVRQCKMQLEDANEKYDAYCAPRLFRIDKLQIELDFAPMTAFARKKELRATLAQLRDEIDIYREHSGIDELSESLKRLQKKRS